ncbi:hypothetical protein IQ254_26385 [Nodosilinea sp. LEGE 07088]|uniref:alr0857 family protein n=1 Tax=Nodosilinea sp. LEGE 07088 TaxID=2777968 RepID=UPI001880B79D|nr:alr0857 family protein [Nodosilinea sp. LEGE 07088]MBE9140687.1 hypothetical protein [Nodosilinea sp. LEGE 07088]
MLKLTYSDTDLLVEWLNLTVEAMVTQRSLVAVRAGQPLLVQPGYGSFVLPADLPGLAAIQSGDPSCLTLAPCDRGWLEVTLRGTWLTDSSDSAEGILVVVLSTALEHRVVDLWRRSQAPLASLSQSEAKGGL